jgi:hypothetical protein
MSADVPSLSGLDAVTGGLVERLLARLDGESRVLPVVVALGARGTGKTALLDAVADRCHDIPHAHLDFERHDRADSRPRELLGHAQGDDEDRDAVDATFCDAFLADLCRRRR